MISVCVSGNQEPSVNLADKATECCLACGSAPNEAGSSPPSSQVRLTPLALLRAAAEPVLVAPAGCASRAKVLTLWWSNYARGRLFGLTGKYGQPVRDALLNGHLSRRRRKSWGPRLSSSASSDSRLPFPIGPSWQWRAPSSPAPLILLGFASPRSKPAIAGQLGRCYRSRERYRER